MFLLYLLTFWELHFLGDYHRNKIIDVRFAFYNH